jgi:hypothetical protein
MDSTTTAEDTNAGAQRAISVFALAELSGLSARAAAADLNARQVATSTGKPWSAKTVIRARERLATE